MDTMKALQILSPGSSEWKDVPRPKPGPGQVLSRVIAVTTCPQWDLHLNSGEPMFPGAPLPYPYTVGQPGHEMFGQVEKLGEGVSEFSIGDRVCAWRDQGHDRQGCYAQFVVHEKDNLLPAPLEEASWHQAPLELAMCVSSSFILLSRMDAVRGRRFGVVGLGGAGLIAVQLAKAEGAREVIGFDPLPSRRDLAVRCGADEALDPTEAFPRRRLTDCLDSGIDCVGSKASVTFLMEHTTEFAALFGVQREPYIYDLQCAASPGLVLVGYPGHAKESAIYAATWMKKGNLGLGCLVTHRLPLESYVEGISLLRKQQAIKVAFFPWGEETP